MIKCSNDFCKEYQGYTLGKGQSLSNYKRMILDLYWIKEFTQNGWDLHVLVAQIVKNLPATKETQVQSLVQEDPLEKGMATHSNILAWRIPWTEEPGRLQSMGSQRVGHDWVTSLSLSNGSEMLPFYTDFRDWIFCTVSTWLSLSHVSQSYLPYMVWD